MTEHEAGRQFTGLAARILFDFLHDELSPEGVATVLEVAGEKRTLSELTDDRTWTSYDQFRCLLEAASASLGGPSRLRGIGGRIARTEQSTAGVEDALHDLGSPDALFASLSQSTHMMWGVVDSESWKVGEGEWMSSRRLMDDFQPFPELCAFIDGVLALAPTLYGLLPGVVTHEDCCCEGGEKCVSRVRWFSAEDPALRADYLGRRVQVLENRLRVLQGTVHELVSGAGIAELLGRIVTAAAHAVRAPAHLLALWEPDGRVESTGLQREVAELTASRLLAGELDANSGFLTVNVDSPRRRYGRLTAINTAGGGFLASERVMLEVYASLAAAALDEAAAVDEARQQAAAAQALLDLSMLLAEVATTQDVAARVARATPLLIDCDHVAVALIDPDSWVGRVVATAGIGPDVAEQLQRLRLPVDRHGEDAGFVVFASTASLESPAREMVTLTGSAAVGRVPISTNGEVIGWIAVGVRSDPDRLSDRNLELRLRGLAGQAAGAISNARLMDQVRHQALHDPLTGLPNRTLLLDRAEQMLIRCRRSGRQPAALFIDLDDFKGANDTFGHQAGDELLASVAGRLVGALREGDTVGRLGGDEFVVLTQGDPASSHAALLAERITEAMKPPFVLPAVPSPGLELSTSIGIASGDRRSAGELLRDADTALYRAKAGGKARYSDFDGDSPDAGRGRFVPHRVDETKSLVMDDDAPWRDLVCAVLDEDGLGTVPAAS